MPREALPCPLTARGSEPVPQLLVAEQALQGGAQSLRTARGYDQPGHAVDDEVAQSTDVRRDDRPPMRHRLQTGDAEALSARRTGDDGRARVQALQVPVRDEAERARDPWPQRPVARYDELHPVGRCDE